MQRNSKGNRDHSIVLMGAGEPLTNYEEVLHFIHLANDPELLNISYRNIMQRNSKGNRDIFIS